MEGRFIFARLLKLLGCPVSRRWGQRQPVCSGIVTLVMGCFPLGTRLLLLGLCKRRAPRSFLPRKGKHNRYGVKFLQSCSTSSCRAAAWLPLH